MADDLSRDRQQSFLQARSGLVMDQSVPSQDLVDMVCNKKPDWLSPTSVLEGDVQKYFENGLPVSTRRAYQAGRYW